jgi:hypothetical protein
LVRKGEPSRICSLTGAQAFYNSDIGTATSDAPSLSLKPSPGLEHQGLISPLFQEPIPPSFSSLSAISNGREDFSIASLMQTDSTTVQTGASKPFSSTDNPHPGQGNNYDLSSQSMHGGPSLLASMALGSLKNRESSMPIIDPELLNDEPSSKKHRVDIPSEQQGERIQELNFYDVLTTILKHVGSIETSQTKDTFENEGIEEREKEKVQSAVSLIEPVSSSANETLMPLISSPTRDSKSEFDATFDVYFL